MLETLGFHGHSPGYFLVYLVDRSSAHGHVSLLRMMTGTQYPGCAPCGAWDPTKLESYRLETGVVSQRKPLSDCATTIVAKLLLLATAAEAFVSHGLSPR